MKIQDISINDNIEYNQFKYHALELGINFDLYKDNFPDSNHNISCFTQAIQIFRIQELRVLLRIQLEGKIKR